MSVSFLKDEKTLKRTFNILNLKMFSRFVKHCSFGYNQCSVKQKLFWQHTRLKHCTRLHCDLYQFYMFIESLSNHMQLVTKMKMRNMNKNIIYTHTQWIVGWWCNGIVHPTDELSPCGQMFITLLFLRCSWLDCQVLGLWQGLKRCLMWQSSHLVKHYIKVCTSAEKHCSRFEQCFTNRECFKKL